MSPRASQVVHTDGTVQLLRRRLLNGQTVPVATLGRTWQDIVAPAPAPTGGAAVHPTHPSRKHDVSRTPVEVAA